MIDYVTTAIVVGYTLLVLAMGLAFARRQNDPETFFLADRTLGTVQVFGTTFSTFLGTGIVFTLASFGYLYGVGAFILPGAAVLGFVLLAWAAPRIKAISDQQQAITLPGLLHSHWSVRTRLLAGVVTASLFTGTLAATLVAAGNILQGLFGLPLRVGIVTVAGLTIVYTVLGGFSSVVWTDLLQMVFIVASFVVVLPGLVLIKEGPRVIASLPDEHLNPASLPVELLVAYLFIGVLAFFGSQDLFQRVYAARRGRVARHGLLVFAGILVVVSTAAISLGIVARAMLPDTVADQALVALADAVVPSDLVGVVLLGFLALAHSDIDSQLLTVASNVTQDFIPALNVDFGNRTSVLLDQVVVVGIGMIAALIAVAVPSLTALFSALGSWFAILGVVVVATLFWNRTTDKAAFAGLTVGFVAPISFVVATGNTQAATIVGIVPTVLIVGVFSVVMNRSEHPE